MIKIHSRKKTAIQVPKKDFLLVLRFMSNSKEKLTRKSQLTTKRNWKSFISKTDRSKNLLKCRYVKSNRIKYSAICYL